MHDNATKSISSINVTFDKLDDLIKGLNKAKAKGVLDESIKSKLKLHAKKQSSIFDFD